MAIPTCRLTRVGSGWRGLQAGSEVLVKHIKRNATGEPTGLPKVHNSQSKIPMTLFSVGWKMRLSSL